MIKLTAIGNLTKDCIVNNANGKTVMNFTVAHNEKYKDANGATINKVTYIEANYWSDRTALAPYLKKGSQVYIEGNPEIRQYTKNDGTFGASMSVRILQVQLLGSPSENNGQQQNNHQGNYHPQNANQGYQQPAQQAMPEPVDDLPF